MKKLIKPIALVLALILVGFVAYKIGYNKAVMSAVLVESNEDTYTIGFGHIFDDDLEYHLYDYEGEDE